MKITINDQEYIVQIIKKFNKNTYIRVTNDLVIVVTTNYLSSKKDIMKLLLKHEDYLIKTINKRKMTQEKNQLFYYLDNIYDIIIVPTIKEIDITNNKIYVSSYLELNKWYKKECLKVFSQRLDIIYKMYDEEIIYPKLKVRKMKTRWGVCNRKNKTITLNSELLKRNISDIDYVIIHELSHFVHFNHSKNFWNLVFKYCPNYKLIRKKMKE